MKEPRAADPFLPHLAKLAEVRDLGEEIKLLRVKLLDGGSDEFRKSQPGQFAFLSAFGVGEAPFGIASLPARSETLDFAVQRLGSVTTALHEMGEGDLVGLRGPMGNCFPMQELRGKNLLVLGGGIGGAPLRPVIQTVLKSRQDYGRLTILWAARRPNLLIFRDEYEEWRNAPDTQVHLTVDEPDSTWNHHVGLITELLGRLAPPPEQAAAITCGPPIMIFHVDKLLRKLGFRPEQSFVTLEARMHCGIRKCGRCNLGEKLVCGDGPVFSMAQVDGLLESFL